eukprot:CAMPEP_0201568120 /NCGR_PEP_ID=MMETSP0190_2-20130828/9002_1 /ASSEMBLY_ACC=CAM_ASM_000263 /TAXON_ID=37353 /ORGANISM="Rosalina sp." /LENGTH=184 /DNA_ID=CAMNT_0047988877 /DNA_START=116 /DNA_END=667 /DNA_ORIENTATION=+
MALTLCFIALIIVAQSIEPTIEVDANGVITINHVKNPIDGKPIITLHPVAAKDYSFDKQICIADKNGGHYHYIMYRKYDAKKGMLTFEGDKKDGILNWSKKDLLKHIKTNRFGLNKPLGNDQYRCDSIFGNPPGTIIKVFTKKKKKNVKKNGKMMNMWKTMKSKPVWTNLDTIPEGVQFDAKLT